MNDATEPRSINTSSTSTEAATPQDTSVAAFVPATSTADSGRVEVTGRPITLASPAHGRPVARRAVAPFFTLLSFVIRDYFRSGWPLVNVAILVILHSLFFNYQSNRSHFFAIEYAVVVVIAALTSAAIFARANRAETYAILARPVRRVTLTAAILLASWLITMLFHLISTLIEGIRFGSLLNPATEGTLWRNPVTHITAMLPMMVAAAATVGLIALLSSFVSSSGMRLGLLVALALLVISFDSKNFPIEGVKPLLQQLPPVLAPAAGALKFATEAQPDSIAVVSLALLAFYALILLAAARCISSQRELILE